MRRAAVEVAIATVPVGYTIVVLICAVGVLLRLPPEPTGLVASLVLLATWGLQVSPVQAARRCDWDAAFTRLLREGHPSSRRNEFLTA